MIKKNYIFLIALMLLVMLNGCIKSNNSNDSATANSSPIGIANDISTYKGNTSSAAEREATGANDDSTVSNNDDTQKENDNVNNGGVLYENEELGFSIELPQNWKGNYVIDESEEDIVQVCFTGKSQVSKDFDGSTQYSNGLLMFDIISKDALDELIVDSVKKIGTIKGVDFYFATPSDYPIGSLDLSTDQATSDLVTDENERKLMKDDFTKAQEMEKDIGNILTTFKVIK